jgi:hypothetical protein
MLCIAIAPACDSAHAPASPSSIPPPTLPPPQIPQFRVSGIVTDAAGGTPIANATVSLQLAKGALSTRTDGDGAYVIPYEANQPYRRPSVRFPGEILGLLVVSDGAFWGDHRNGHWTIVQTIPWGTPDITHNVRLRPVRTLAAGQSMELTVDPDSSLVWDQEWDPWIFPSTDTLGEEFLVSVSTAGILTLDARPQAGGLEATLTCPYVGCPSWGVRGTLSVSFPVQGGGPFYFALEVPRTSAPQRVTIQASLR